MLFSARARPIVATRANASCTAYRPPTSPVRRAMARPPAPHVAPSRFILASQPHQLQQGLLPEAAAGRRAPGRARRLVAPLRVAQALPLVEDLVVGIDRDAHDRPRRLDLEALPPP